MTTKGMTVDKITAIFKNFYETALKLPYVKKPMSWALFQTWKYCDKVENERKKK